MPDTAVDYLILPEEQGNSLLALLPPEKPYPLQSLRILGEGLPSPLHAFLRFEPLPGKEQLREELKLLLEPTRAESGCIRIHLYEALREPLVFYIHSE